MQDGLKELVTFNTSLPPSSLPLHSQSALEHLIDSVLAPPRSLVLLMFPIAGTAVAGLLATLNTVA